MRVKITPENINGIFSAEALSNENETQGVLNFLFDTKTKILRSKLTIVASSMRGKGIASLMWSEVIREYSPVIVSVSTTTPGGEALIRSLKKKYTSIEWDIW